MNPPRLKYVYPYIGKCMLLTDFQRIIKGFVGFLIFLQMSAKMIEVRSTAFSTQCDRLLRLPVSAIFEKLI